MRILFALLSFLLTWQAAAQTPAVSAPGRKLFEARCGGCHGADGAGGEHGPGILESGRRNARAPLRDIITKGIPGAGMPPFVLPAADLDQLVAYVEALRSPAAAHPPEGDAEAGERFFAGKGNCLRCHAVKGSGPGLGPDLSNLGGRRRVDQILKALNNPAALRTPGYRFVSLKLADGRTIRGLAKNESTYDVQLLDLEGKLHLLARRDIASETAEPKPLMPPVSGTAGEKRDLLAYLARLTNEGPPRVVTPSKSSDGAFEHIVNPRPGEWPTYNGQLSGNRHSDLTQISVGNVAQLGAKWIFPIESSRRLQVTPVVVDGVMYVTAANEVHALDARSGRQIWSYSQPLTKGVVGDAASAINRGVAIHGSKLFMLTDHAHMLALDRITGRLLWDTELADYRQHYGGTSAPLVVKDLVLAGTSGGDEGARGFVDALDVHTGKRAWRFWFMPAPGEPGSETWVGRAIEHGCATGWMSGTYDAATDLIYWPTGNPCPDYNGDERKGDNLYSSSVVALDPAAGKLKWYFQFTPHDVHDWDAVQTPVLVDAKFRGQDRKLLLQANRNGFFYVLDRATGEFLLGEPFVKRLTWASGLDAKGRPKLLPGADPTPQGTKACPAVAGAANWMSTSYNPSTGLFYVLATESCSIYTKSDAWWKPGESFYGGSTRQVPGEVNERYLRAIDIQTGKLRWQLPIVNPMPFGGWGGLLSTASGLVFFCDDSGAFAAADAATGKPLWSFHTNHAWHASPMTYMVDGKQYVAVAAGSSIITFALP